mgnify:CR=1 FL=1
MKLLICTQAVDKNHSNLGSFHRWLEEFAKHCESVSVVCLEEGAHTLPPNVTVWSAGKERGVSRPMRWVRILRHLIRVRHEHDAVFVHMNPEYVVLGGLLWRLWGKRIGLWYTHKSVTLKLRLAVRFANIIFTASKESFRISSPKVRVTGHGIDTGLFVPGVRPAQLRVVTAGRISPTKRLREMLSALDVLAARGIDFDFTIAGAPIFPEDERYLKEIEEEILRRPYASAVHCIGPVPYARMPETLVRASVFLNLSQTGSVDRAVLEAASCGVVPVTTNDAFRQVLSPYGVYVGEDTPQHIAEALLKAQQVDPAPLMHYVREQHSLSTLIPRLIAYVS